MGTAYYIYVMRVWAWLSEFWVKLDFRSDIGKKAAVSHPRKKRNENCILLRPFRIPPCSVIQFEVFERPGKPIRGDFEDSAVASDVGFGRTR